MMPEQESEKPAAEPGAISMNDAVELHSTEPEALDITQPMTVIATDETMVGSQELPTLAPAPLLRASQRSHVGLVRERNEDACFVFTAETGGQELLLPFGLFVVADGMGGHQDGDRASRVVSRTLAAHVLDRLYRPLLTEKGPSAGQTSVHEVLAGAVQQANHSLRGPNGSLESGTTVTAALVAGRRLYLTHVGDSRAYLLADGQLEQLTNDHSYVRRLQETGQITEEEAAVHPHRNVLYRAVGQGDELEIDFLTRRLPPQGKLCLCSDGLWGLVPERAIHSALELAMPLPEVADMLVEMALTAGGHDNITVVIVEFAF